MKKCFVLFLLIAGVVGFVSAQVPRTISYQGFYTDASGNPVNGGPHKIMFRFFDATTNAETTSLAREIENVTINKGIISVSIGGGDPSHTSGPDNAALPLDVWTQAFKIQVFVNGDPIGAQVPLTTVPYAFVAGSVDGANVTGTLAASKISGTVAGAQIGTGINASNITTGTLNPALFTDGSIPGTKLALDINATNIASGTLSDSRLESTLDVTGVNTTGNITTGGGIHVGGTSDPGADNLVVDGTITGNGSGISALNATNISSGTIADARLETNIDISGFVTTVGGIHVGGVSDPGVDNLVVDGTITGNGSGISGLNGGNISSGTISDSRLESTIDVVAVNTSGNITTGGGLHVGSASDPGADNLLVDGTITGNGSGITALNASNLSSGTVSNARLATNIDVGGNLTTVGGIHVGGLTNPGADNLVVDGTISGNGSGITTLNASNISSGTLANGRLSTNVDVAGYLTTINGMHVGSATAPGTDNLEVDGFTKPGSDAPSIKMKKLTGTTAAAEGGEVLIAHGLTVTKIISVSVIVEATSTFHIHEAYTNNVEFQFNWYLTDTQIRIWNTAGNSGSILSKPIKILITYEQ